MEKLNEVAFITVPISKNDTVNQDSYDKATLEGSRMIKHAIARGFVPFQSHITEFNGLLLLTLILCQYE